MSIAITAAGCISQTFHQWSELKQPNVSENESETGWFEPKEDLGKWNRKYFTKATKYLMSASIRASDDVDSLKEHYSPDKIGVIIGTNQADLWVRKNIDDTVRLNGCSELSAIEVPSFSVNIPACYLSIMHQLNGPNITLTNPYVAGVESLHFASRLISRSVASTVLCGAVEEPDPDRLSEKCNSQGGACLFFAEPQDEALKRDSTILGLIGDSGLGFNHALYNKPEVVANFLSNKISNDQDNIWLVCDCEKTASRVFIALDEQYPLLVTDLTKLNKSFKSEYSLLAVMQILWLLANGHTGTVVVVSSLGHIVWLNLSTR